VDAAARGMANTISGGAPFFPKLYLMVEPASHTSTVLPFVVVQEKMTFDAQVDSAKAEQESTANIALMTAIDEFFMGFTSPCRYKTCWHFHLF
jgi:hypothetical protein